MDSAKLPRPVRYDMIDAKDNTTHEAEQSINQLALSCKSWCAAQASGLKLTHSSALVLQDLMHVPNIFDRPIPFRADDFANENAYSRSVVLRAINQLQVAGLVMLETKGRVRLVQLVTPSAELIAAHEARMQRMSDKMPYMPVEQALPLWKAFTAKFAAGVP